MGVISRSEIMGMIHRTIVRGIHEITAPKNVTRTAALEYLAQITALSRFRPALLGSAEPGWG